MSRLVVVTGGTRGIGAAIADRFRAAGDTVLAPGRADCDVTSEEAVAAYFASVGPVDVLVNNAGISSSAPVSRTSLADWRSQFEVNATGAFLCTRAVLDGMRSRDSGRIVTVASTASHVGYRYTAGYTASKHAAVGFMRAVAAELAGTGVTANAVCPAYVDTAMTDGAVGAIQKFTGRGPEDARRFLELKQPIGRLITVDEVAEAVWFCVANGGFTGQGLNVDGGAVQG